MKYLRLFEEFTKEEFDFMTNNDKTYLRNFTKYTKDISNIDIKNKIKEYNFNQFEEKYDGFEMIIYPDDKFRSLLKMLNFDIAFFSLSIDRNRLNSINLDFTLPIGLRGLNIGKNIYKLAVNKFDFITSDYGLTEFASGVWSKLILDEEYYSYTCGSKVENFGTSGIIRKNISDEKLNIIINKIKENIYKIYNVQFENLIFDNKIKNKMKWK